MKRGFFLSFAAIVLLFLNCLEYNEKIVINDDGSGTIKIDYSGPTNSEVNDDNEKYTASG